jgi:hypothetical protein
VEASYVGSQTRELQVSKSQSFLTVDQLALGTPYLSQVVPNPFFGLFPINTSRGAQATIQRSSLLTQFPQFSGVTMTNQSLGKAGTTRCSSSWSSDSSTGCPTGVLYDFENNGSGGVS